MISKGAVPAWLIFSKANLVIMHIVVTSCTIILWEYAQLNTGGGQGVVVMMGGRGASVEFEPATVTQAFLLASVLASVIAFGDYLGRI